MVKFDRTCPHCHKLTEHAWVHFNHEGSRLPIKGYYCHGCGLLSTFVFGPKNVIVDKTVMKPETYLGVNYGLVLKPAKEKQ